MGEGSGGSMLSLGALPFQHLNVSTSLEAFHYLGFFMEVPLSRHG